MRASNRLISSSSTRTRRVTPGISNSRSPCRVRVPSSSPTTWCDRARSQTRRATTLVSRACARSSSSRQPTTGSKAPQSRPSAARDTTGSRCSWWLSHRRQRYIVAMIELVEKPEAVLATWLATMWTEYHADLLAAGMSVAEADRNVERNRTNLLDGERPSAGQHILDVVSDGAVVGTLWLGHQPGQHEWFIYDIAIDEERRGTGLGRATMLAAE